MDRLILVLAVLTGVLTACTPADKDRYAQWDPLFTNRPAGFDRSVTALWVAQYVEDPGTHRFIRSTAWGAVPEKLIPDGHGGFTVAVPLLVQSETSDGPQPDQFETVLVRVVQTGDRFALAPNEALPGETIGWDDGARRTVRFRGQSTGPGGNRILWQFQGRY